MYYDKWWKNHGHHKENACATKKTVDQKAMANALGVVNIGGIFVVLLCGLAFAVMVAIVEFCWSNHISKSSEEAAAAKAARAKEPPASLCLEMVRALAPYLFGVRREEDEVGQTRAGVAVIGRENCSSCSLVRDNTNL